MNRQAQSLFFSLPRELRDQIYLLLMKEGQPHRQELDQSNCPIGSCSLQDDHAFRTLITLSHVSRYMAEDVKDTFDLYLSDRVTLPFWNLDKLLAAVDNTYSDPSQHGLRNARFILRQRIRCNIPQGKQQLMRDLRVAHNDGGEFMQTINDSFHCRCLETAHLGVEWRRTFYSPLRGSMQLCSWRRQNTLPRALAPSGPDLQKWLVLEGRLRDLFEPDGDFDELMRDWPQVVIPGANQWAS